MLHISQESQKTKNSENCARMSARFVLLDPFSAVSNDSFFWGGGVQGGCINRPHSLVGIGKIRRQGQKEK